MIKDEGFVETNQGLLIDYILFCRKPNKKRKKGKGI